MHTINCYSPQGKPVNLPSAVPHFVRGGAFFVPSLPENNEKKDVIRMIFKAVLSNKAHPEYGTATIPFPIPDDQYDSTIELLDGLDIGDATAQDCRVDEVLIGMPILNRLVTQSANVDELDYLAKRLDGFNKGEGLQFQAMASILGLSDIKDLINLTFCCQQATVIADFSDLEQIGKDHSMNINSGSMPMDEYRALDGQSIALDLIQSGAGVVTPYGVAYDNSMKLEQVYSGRSFPQYLYNAPLLTLGVPSAQAAETAWLYLPAPKQQIDRTLRRVGTTGGGAAYFVEDDMLPSEVSRMLERPDDPVPVLNRMCHAISSLSAEEVNKLEAVVVMAQPQDAEGICQLAENLGQFEFVLLPDGQKQEHVITELGYVAYHGTMALDELMGAYQREQEMGLS